MLVTYTDTDGVEKRAYAVVITGDKTDSSVEHGSVTRFLDADGSEIAATPLMILEDLRPNGGLKPSDVAAALSLTRGMYIVRGLVDDGNFATFSGTDNAAQLQAEINYAIYVLKAWTIIIPAGVYCVGDTVHIGYGVNSLRDSSPYVTVILEGVAGTGVNTASAGTLLLWTGPKDRPMLAISGGRQCRVRKMALLGTTGYAPQSSLASDYVYYKGLQESWNVQDAHLIATWVDPRISVAGSGVGTSGALDGRVGAGTGSSVSAPWCAIAVDPYTSTSVPTPYPNVSFPIGILQTSFEAAPYQYNKAASSDTDFEDLFISGFLADIVVAPGGGTGQSDFTRYSRLWLQNSVYGISVNGSNPRENSLKDSYINQCHTGISTGLHCTAANGSAGQWGAAIINTGFDRNIKAFHFNAVGEQYTAPVKFLNCYGEGVYAIGTYGQAQGGSAQDDNTLILDSCFFNFNHQGTRGVPARLIELSDNAGLVIEGGAYTQYVGAFSINAPSDHVSIRGMARFKKAGTPTSLYEKIADSGSGGGVVCKAVANAGFGHYSAKYISYDTSGNAGETWCNEDQPTTAAKLGNWYARNYYGSRIGNKAGNPRGNNQIAMTAIWTGISLVGRLFQATWNSGRSNQQIYQNGYGVGDIFIEQSTGYVFYIYSSTSATLKALMMTGWSVRSSNVIGGSGGNGTVTYLKMTGNNFPAQTVTVTFSSATAFSVNGSTQGAMGSGTVGQAFAGTGGLGFTINQGSTPFAAGSTITMAVSYSYANGWSPDSSYIAYCMNTRAFTPATYVAGTATSASASVTSCADDSGSNTNVAAALPPASAVPAGCSGVALWADSSYDNMFTNSGLITANAAGTLTLTNSAQKSGTRKLDMAVMVLADAANP
jgi:hypothetical protein